MFYEIYNQGLMAITASQTLSPWFKKQNKKTQSPACEVVRKKQPYSIIGLGKRKLSHHVSNGDKLTEKCIKASLIWTQTKRDMTSTCGKSTPLLLSLQYLKLESGAPNQIRTLLERNLSCGYIMLRSKKLWQITVDAYQSRHSFQSLL